MNLSRFTHFWCKFWGVLKIRRKTERQKESLKVRIAGKLNLLFELQEEARSVSLSQIQTSIISVISATIVIPTDYYWLSVLYCRIFVVSGSEDTVTRRCDIQLQYCRTAGRHNHNVGFENIVLHFTPAEES